MNINSISSDFLENIQLDARIGPSHISLFMAILHQYRKKTDHWPIIVYKRELMLLAKISARGTYYKCLHDLENSGYIIYVPSHTPLKGSRIYLTEINQLYCS